MKHQYIVSAVFAGFVLFGAAAESVAYDKNHNEEDVAAVRAVINDMNKAVSNADLDSLLKTFAPDALRVDFFTAGKDTKEASKGQDKQEYNAAITSSNLSDSWRKIAPILFSAMKDYKREASHVLVRTDGNMAIAWARINTRYVLNDPEKTADGKQFREAMMLKKIDGEWRIATITNNRND